MKNKHLPSVLPSVSVLVSGSEILDGRVLDTNSHLIIETISSSGLSISHTLSCTDDLPTLKSCLDFLSAHSEIIIISGGMGPTSDDLTREAASDWLGLALTERSEAREQLHEFYAKRGRTFDQSNHKQVLFPEGALIIKNPRGSAPGFLVEKTIGKSSCWIFALPGVPGELAAMLHDSVLPLISEKILNLTHPLEVVPPPALRLFGLPEAEVGARVGQVPLPAELTVSFRASFPEVHVLLKDRLRKYNTTQMHAFAEQLAKAIGPEFLISRSLDVSLDMVVHELLGSKCQSLAVAESCTGGMLGEFMTRMSGSSRAFFGSAVTYSNAAKQQVLGVKHELLDKYGAVSAPVAAAMANGARLQFQSDLALSITGIAGPEGGTPEKPVGTFFVGYSNGTQSSAFKCIFPNSRSRIRRFATFTALDILRRQLLSLQSSWPQELESAEQ